MRGIDEKTIVERIRARFPAGRARVGIGDDAAVVDLGPGTVVTSDALVEDVDFTRSIPLVFVGAKSLAVNLSDLAAMGAVPHSFTATLASPPWLMERVDELLDGLAAAAGEYGIELIGGDLSAASIAFLSITALGRIEDRPLLRSGARPGDRIFVSRQIGGSSAGLELLRRGWLIDGAGSVQVPDGLTPTFEQRAFAEAAIRQHVDPRHEAELGPRLAALPVVHSCIDISDGLSTDLRRLCDASGVGALVEWERLPAFDALDTIGRSLLDPDRATLHGGEELALLFTADAREAEISYRLGRPVFQVGRIDDLKGSVRLERNGEAAELQPGGFDHFAES
jgi:thiamine-monophosphate kinase